MADKVPAVLIPGPDVALDLRRRCRSSDQGEPETSLPGAYLVQLDVAGEGFRTSWVEIARKNRASLLARRDRERTDAGEPVDDDVGRLERLDEPSVFGLETRVPVDFRKVEAELAVVFGLRLVPPR